MINFILSRKNIVIKEMLELCLKNNTELKKYFESILKSFIKIKNLEYICRFLIFINRKNYFGIYAPLYNKKIKKELKRDNLEEFSLFLDDPKPEEIYKNNSLTKEEKKLYEFFLKLETMSYLFFYEKRINQYDYLINETNLENCKEQIYLNKNVSLKHKYFEEKNILTIKKGKDSKIIQITDMIKNLVFEEKLEREIIRFLKQNYLTEIKIISYAIYEKNQTMF